MRLRPWLDEERPEERRLLGIGVEVPTPTERWDRAHQSVNWSSGIDVDGRLSGKAGGDGGLEALRVLKRRLSDVVYQALRADLVTHQPAVA